MARCLLSLYIAFTLVSCAPEPSGSQRTVSQPRDPKIAKLVAELSSGPRVGGWGYPILELPRNATTSQVVARVIEMTGFEAGHIKEYKIRAIEKVPLYDATAVRISSDLGDKIIFMRYEGRRIGWWTHIFDVK